jgi:hypothetical protein
MTDESTQEKQRFTIILPEGADCNDATKALGERYLCAAGGDPVLSVLLACQDVMWLRDCASHGLTRGRKLTIDED